METNEKSNSIIAVYQSHSEAESAVKHLKDSSFDLTRLSIVGRDFQTDEHVIGYYNAGDRVKYWGQSGLFWGSVWGMLFGSAFFMVPGVGPLIMAGPIVTWLVGILEGAIVVGSLSALGAALYGLGIPENSILQYETAIKAGKFLLIANGSVTEIQHAKNVLGNSVIESIEEHSTKTELVPALG
jgi:uncharacterized membrane protein